MSRLCNRLIAGVAAICVIAVMLAGCAEQPVIGEIRSNASIALMSYESVADGNVGIVYREVNRFEALLVRSDVPVLVAFYSDLSPVNSRVIPRLEQMADDYHGQLQILWIDAYRETDLAQSFYVDNLPQFTVVVDAETKRSLVGFGDDGASQLVELVTPYIQ